MIYWIKCRQVSAVTYMHICHIYARMSFRSHFNTPLLFCALFFNQKSHYDISE